MAYTSQPLAQFAPTGAQNQLSNYGGASLVNVDPTQLASGRLDTLLRSDNPILQMARSRASSAALARGAGVDGGSWSYNAELGMGNALTPIAQADAQQINDINQGNQTAINQERMTREAAEATRNAAATNRASQMDILRAQQAHDDATRAQDREWQLADNGTQAIASARSQFMNQIYSTIFSSPEVWRDPQGAMGLLNTYASNFDDFFNSAFPEYSGMQSGDVGLGSAGGSP